MEDKEILNLWKAQNDKLEQTLSINKILLKENTNLKTQTILNSLIKHKRNGIIALFPYLTLLGLLLAGAIINFSHSSMYFIVSVGAIFIVNIKALYDYIKHLAIAKNLNYEGSITEIQEKLSKLQLSIINHARIMCLQFPFFTTWYLNSNWFPSQVGAGYIIFQLLLTGSFTWFSIWLFKNHTPANLEKSWFRKMIAGSGGKQVMQALAFYKDLEKFKMEKI